MRIWLILGIVAILAGCDELSIGERPPGTFDEVPAAVEQDGKFFQYKDGAYVEIPFTQPVQLDLSDREYCRNIPPPEMTTRARLAYSDGRVFVELGLSIPEVKACEDVEPYDVSAAARRALARRRAVATEPSEPTEATEATEEDLRDVAVLWEERSAKLNYVSFYYRLGTRRIEHDDRLELDDPTLTLSGENGAQIGVMWIFDEAMTPETYSQITGMTLSWETKE